MVVDPQKVLKRLYEHTGSMGDIYGDRTLMVDAALVRDMTPSERAKCEDATKEMHKNAAEAVALRPRRPLLHNHPLHDRMEE